jgi:hypothetical protein
MSVEFIPLQLMPKISFGDGVFYIFWFHFS